MKKTIAVIASALCLAVPAVAMAGEIEPGSEVPSAQQVCSDQRDVLGVDLFRSTYGTNHNKRNAFGKCVSKTDESQEDARVSARAECAAERSDPDFALTHDGLTFAEFYGKDPGHKNAFGRCVASKAAAEQEEATEAIVEAAGDCKAERKLDPEAFRENYGTNHNKRNAFGKCVSQNSKPDDEDDGDDGGDGTEEL